MFRMKMYQILRKRPKSQNFPIFKAFMHIFKFFDRLRQTQPLKGSKRKIVMPSMLRREINAVFRTKSFRNRHLKRQISENFKSFEFSLFLFNFC